MEAQVITGPKRRRATGSTAREAGQSPTSREAFTGFVHRYDRQLRTLAFRLLGSANDMDDVLQEAYLKAYRAYPSFRHEASPSTWLYRITYNTCIDHLRRHGRLEAHGSLSSIESLAETGFEPRSAEDVASAVLTRRDLEVALASLAPDQRAAVLLVDALDHDYATAAVILGIAPGTVASRLNRARTALRATLSAPSEEVSR
ncbi:MAG: RNA polymerase sigma factor [Actinomycetota bacterium]|nr:RNA polymerase sigma factor [Actinomycetota bacterium]